MSDLKKIYKTLQKDPFPNEMRIVMGEQELVFAKKTWTIDGEQRGLRYGENPDQPAALYALAGGGWNWTASVSAPRAPNSFRT